MSETENTSSTFTYRGVRFSIIGSDKLKRTQIRYRLRGGLAGTLEAEVLCDMAGRENTAANAQEEAWNFMMNDLVSATPRQFLIRYVKPEMMTVSSDVSLPTITFKFPPGVPSRIFYVSTGDSRGVYIFGLDDDTVCICKETKRRLLEDYARRTLYEPLNENQQTVPPEQQTLDEEARLQSMLPRVFTSVSDLDNNDPLHLTTVLAAVHFIIVSIDSWRKRNQFYACRNELRLRKIRPRPDGNRIMIKEEGDVLYIIMPLDCTKQTLGDILICALHGYCYYLNTKLRSDFIESSTGRRIRFNKEQRDAWWSRITTEVYNRYYPYSKLLTVGYDEQDVERIPLYNYIDTQHDIPEQSKLGRTSYQQIITTTYDKMKTLKERSEGVSVRLVREWAVTARQLINEYPNNYVGVFDEDSKIPADVSGKVCPLPTSATATAAAAAEAVEVEPEAEVEQQQQQDEEEGEKKEECLEAVSLITPSGSRELKFQKLSERGKRASGGYKIIEYESALFSLYDNDERVLDSIAVEHAAAFLKDYGFVILRGSFFSDDNLMAVTESIADQISKLYVDNYKIKSAQPMDGDSNKLSSYFDPSESNLKNFPISAGMCRLDLEPLVYDRAVWEKIRSNEKLFQSYRAVVEHTPGSASWAGKDVRLLALAPVTTFKKKFSAQKVRIRWQLKQNRRTPYNGMIAVNDMEFPDEGGFVVAPGFHTLAEGVRREINADDDAKRYYYNEDHLHTFPAHENSKNERIPNLVQEILSGTDQRPGLLCSMAFVPLRAGDIILWNENLPHSWLRSDSMSNFSLGQLYSLTSETRSKEEIEMLIKKGVLSYKIEGRMKAEMRRQENAKPRNTEWVWYNEADIKDNPTDHSKIGWNWLAYREHSSVNTYNPSWEFDKRKGIWIKNEQPERRIDATYDYKTFFRTDDEPLRELTFGTKRFSIHSQQVEGSFQFPSTSTNGVATNSNGELSNTKEEAIQLVDRTVTNLTDELDSDSTADQIFDATEGVKAAINEATTKQTVLSQLQSLALILRPNTFDYDINLLDDGLLMYKATRSLRNFLWKEVDRDEERAKTILDAALDLSIYAAFAIELLSDDLSAIVQKRATKQLKSARKGILSDGSAKFDNLSFARQRVSTFLRSLEQLLIATNDDTLMDMVLPQVNALSDDFNLPVSTTATSAEDVLQQLSRDIFQLIPTVKQRLQDWPVVSNALETDLERITVMIQKNVEETDVLKELNELNDDVLARRMTATDNDLRQALKSVQNDISSLRNSFQEALLGPSSFEQEEETEGVTRKRKRPVIVLTETEEEEQEERSIEEQLEERGISRDTVSAILSVMDATSYRMQHQQNSSAATVVGQIEEGNVYLESITSAVLIEVRFSRNELQLLAGDTLRLLFLRRPVVTVPVDNELIQKKQITVTEVVGDDRRESSRLILTTNVRGDVVSATWAINIDIVLRLIAEMGPERIKRRRVTTPLFKQEKEEEKQTPLLLGEQEEEEPTQQLPIEGEEEERVVLPAALRILQEDADRLVRQLDSRFFTAGLTSHRDYQKAIDNMVSAYRDDGIPSSLTNAAKIAQQKLASDLNSSLPSKKDVTFAERTAVTRIQAAARLLDMVSRGSFRGRPAKLMGLLSSSISTLASVTVVIDRKKYETAKQALLSAYSSVSRGKKINRSVLNRARKSLQALGDSADIRSVQDAVDTIFTKYSKSIAEKRQTAPMEVETVVEDAFLKEVTENAPFELSPLAVFPSDTQKETIKASLEEAIESFQQAAAAVRNNIPATENPNAFVSAKRNISDLAEILDTIVLKAAKINNWSTVVNVLTFFVSREWFIFSSSIDSSVPALTYPDDVQQLLRSEVVRRPLLSGLRSLHRVYTTLNQLASQAEPATPPLAQEMDFSEFELMEDIKRSELEKRSKDVLKKEITIAPGGLAARRRRLQRRPRLTEAEQFEFQQ